MFGGSHLYNVCRRDSSVKTSPTDNFSVSSPVSCGKNCWIMLSCRKWKSRQCVERRFSVVRFSMRWGNARVIRQKVSMASFSRISSVRRLIVGGGWLSSSNWCSLPSYLLIIHLLASSGIDVIWICLSSGVPSFTVMKSAFSSPRAIAWECALLNSLDVGPSKRIPEVSNRMRWLTRPCRICGVRVTSPQALEIWHRLRGQCRGNSLSLRSSLNPLSNSKDWMSVKCEPRMAHSLSDGASSSIRSAVISEGMDFSWEMRSSPWFSLSSRAPSILTT